MKLIVGLGNPGEKYEYTRHNAGFMVLNQFVSEKLNNSVVWLEESKFNSQIIKIADCLFVEPLTFMNKSGEAVSKLMSYYHVDHNDLLVLHDDVDIKFGDFKVKKGSQAAGHHGVEDIISKTGSSEFWRMRIGVGRPENNKFQVEDYVLQKFSEEELTVLKNLYSSSLKEKLNTFCAF